MRFWGWRHSSTHRGFLWSLCILWSDLLWISNTSSVRARYSNCLLSRSMWSQGWAVAGTSWVFCFVWTLAKVKGKSTKANPGIWSLYRIYYNIGWGWSHVIRAEDTVNFHYPWFQNLWFSLWTEWWCRKGNTGPRMKTCMYRPSSSILVTFHQQK